MSCPLIHTEAAGRILSRIVGKAETAHRARDQWIDRQCEAAIQRAMDDGESICSGHGGASGLTWRGRQIEHHTADEAADEWDRAYARFRALMEANRGNPEYATSIEAAFWEGMEIDDGNDGTLWEAVKDAVEQEEGL